MSVMHPVERLRVWGNGGSPVRWPSALAPKKEKKKVHHGLRSAIRKQPASFSVALSRAAKPTAKHEIYDDPVEIERLADMWAAQGDWTELANSALSNYVLQGTKVNDKKPLSNYERALWAKARRCRSEPAGPDAREGVSNEREQSAKTVKSDNFLPALDCVANEPRESSRSAQNAKPLELFGRHMPPKDFDDEDHIDMAFYVAQYQQQLPDSFRPQKKLRFSHTLETPRDRRADKTQLRSCLKVEAQTREVPRDNVKMKHFTQYVRTTNPPRVKFGMMPTKAVQRINYAKAQPKYAFVSVQSYLNYPVRENTTSPEKLLRQNTTEDDQRQFASMFDWIASPQARKSSAYSDIAVQKDLEEYFKVGNKTVGSRTIDSTKKSVRSASRRKSAMTVIEDVEDTWAADEQEFLADDKDVRSQKMEVGEDTEMEVQDH